MPTSFNFTHISLLMYVDNKRFDVRHVLGKTKLNTATTIAATKTTGMSIHARNLMAG